MEKTEASSRPRVHGDCGMRARISVLGVSLPTKWHVRQVLESQPQGGSHPTGDFFLPLLGIVVGLFFANWSIRT